MLNPHGWYRMPIWNLMVNGCLYPCRMRGPRVISGRKPRRRPKAKSFRIVLDFTVIADLLFESPKGDRRIVRNEFLISLTAAIAFVSYSLDLHISLNRTARQQQTMSHSLLTASGTLLNHHRWESWRFYDQDSHYDDSKWNAIPMLHKTVFPILKIATQRTTDSGLRQREKLGDLCHDFNIYLWNGCGAFRCI